MAQVKITSARGAELSEVVVANDASTPTANIEIYINNASYSNNQLSEAARQIRKMADKLEKWGGSD